MNKIVVFIMGFGLTALSVLSCSTDNVSTGDFDEKVTYNGQTRKYLVHVPESYDGKKAVALLFALHFYGGSREAMADVTQLSVTSDEQGFIVVYPQSYGLSWQDSDTGFIHMLTGILEEEYVIDPDRIYATGYSNGAYIAHLLAATSNRISSASMVAGGIMEYSFSDLAPDEPVSTIHFHARNDSVLPYYGDEYHEAVETMMYAWAEANGCDKGPDSFYHATGALRQTWYRSGGACEIVLWTTEEGDHYWPSDSTQHKLSANNLMWEFFESIQ